MGIRSFLAVAMIAALLAGCKSSGTAPNPPGGGIATLSLVAQGGATFTAIAYQTSANGAWKLLPSGQTTITAGADGAYGVAWVCSTSTNVVELYQATIRENSTPVVTCGSPSATASLDGTTSETGFASATTTYVTAEEFSSSAPPNGAYSMPAVPATQDVFAGLDDNSTLLAAKVYPNVVVGSGPTTQNVGFTSSDTLGSSVTITSGNPLSGETFEDLGTAYENIAQGTGVGLGDSSTQSLSYPTLASGDTGPNDAYLAEDIAEGTDEANVSLTYDQTPPTSISFTSAFALTVTASTNPVYDLDYTGYSALSGGVQEYGVLEAFGGTEIYATVTGGYLSATGSTNYTFPDITLSGFPTMTIPASTSVGWFASAAYGTPVALQAFGAIVLDASHSSHAQSLLKSLSQFTTHGIIQQAATGGRVSPQSSSSSTSGFYYAAVTTGSFTSP